MSLAIANTTVSSGPLATYAAAWAAFAPVATPTNIFSITGSATKTIRVLRIGFSATRTTATVTNVQLNRYTSALTGGTPVAPTAVVKYDTNSANSTATAVTYTANTTGGGAGTANIRNIKMVVPTATPTGASQNEYIFDYTANYSESLVLRGTSEVIALTLLSTTMTGGSVCMWVEWTEE